jgi:5-methylcytosine-specific restriction endonuclease McrA
MSYALDPAHTDPKRVKKEREKAQKLKKSNWWRQILAKGLCHYCGQKFAAGDLTMDHVVPIARGGTSTAGNVVPSCRPCNQGKKLETPAEALLRQIAAERGGDSEPPGESDDDE